MYIIGGVTVLLIAGWYFMGGSMAGNMAGVDTDRNLDGSTTYTSEEGSVTVGGNSMPANWPSDAPQNFAGATITFSGTSNPQTGQVGSAVSYTVRASAQAVADYYKSELESKGWTVAATANMGAASAISATKDTRTFGAYIADTGDGSVAVTAGLEL
jgi:hypothetical protein